ncbi:MAG TPA: hypothetical protein VFI42_19530 [Thermomicrobiaceae bacterium]|nr:hypothetical protein [Thermomicrobiaceae bacterium]
MAVTDHSVVVGVFDTVAQAERATSDLAEAGFPENELGFMVKGEGTAGGGALAPGDTHMTEGAAIGAAAGGLGGALAGAALAGVIPGIGPILSAGILTAAALGAFTGAASTGLLGAVIGLGFSEDQARFIEAELRAGHAIVTVRTGDEDQQARAEAIMRRDGARFAALGDELPPEPEANDTHIPTA